VRAQRQLGTACDHSDLVDEHYYARADVDAQFAFDAPHASATQTPATPPIVYDEKFINQSQVCAHCVRVCVGDCVCVQVHGMNVLRALFRESSIGDRLMPFATDCYRLVLAAYRAKV
jgi:hypothetical protein